MDSDLTGKHDERTVSDVLLSQTTQRPWPDNILSRQDHAMMQHEIAAKAQRRADLVTLTAAAMTGILAFPGGPTTSSRSREDLVRHYSVAAVDYAEAALALIEERTK